MNVLYKKIAQNKKKAIVLTFVLCPIIYIIIALLPYVGGLYVNAETVNSFSMENFFGYYVIPERVMLLDDPHEAFFHRVNIISNAEEQILLAVYSIAEGASTDIIIGALLSAAERGVDITIITNENIGGMPPRYRRVLAGHSTIELYFFNRFEFFRPQYANAIFHDKYMTVDNTFMILGGRNLGDRFFNPECFSGRLALDTEVLVYNTDTNFAGSIADAGKLFAAKIASRRTSLFTPRRNPDWEAQKAHFISLYVKYRNSLPTEGFDYYLNTVAANRITLIHNNFDEVKKESIVGHNLIMLAMYSDRTIAQSPYMSLNPRTTRLIGEMSRGRDITLLTNSLASTTNLPAFSSYYVSRRNILRTTEITIYEYQCTASSIHGKVYLFDYRLTAIGSFNLNERSLRSDTESMLIIDSEAFNSIVLEYLNDFLAASLRVGADNNYVPCEYVEPASVTRRKRALYTVAGHLLRGLRFMF